MSCIQSLLSQGIIWNSVSLIITLLWVKLSSSLLSSFHYIHAEMEDDALSFVNVVQSHSSAARGLLTHTEDLSRMSSFRKCVIVNRNKEKQFTNHGLMVALRLVSCFCLRLISDASAEGKSNKNSKYTTQKWKKTFLLLLMIWFCPEKKYLFKSIIEVIYNNTIVLITKIHPWLDETQASIHHFYNIWVVY